jgi:cation:H+ antiporter
MVAMLFLAGGLVLLWKGADLLVGGAVGLAERLAVSQLVVGLTVVAMGTSAPEAAASIAAVVSGRGDIAIGNVYGSNIANLALVGGLVSLIRPLQVQARTLRREVPAMLGVALLLWPLLRNLHVSRLDGICLLALFACMVTYTIWTARSGAESASVAPLPSTVRHARTATRDAGLILVGLIGLGVGAKLAVIGAADIGAAIGLSDAVIGSTIMAVGTSLPELVTCVIAAVRGHHDISVGNLVGSNIFNTLLVTGVAATVTPFGVGPQFAGGTHFWIMIGVSVGFAVALIAGRRSTNRPSGAVLLGVYVAYLVYLLMSMPAAS